MVCITALCSLGSAAQPVPPAQQEGEWFSINQGLSQGMVRDIMQDKEGFMWFATKDGLNKYDGYKVTVFRNDLQDSFSLPENHITQLLQDTFGNFWVGTLKNGLYLFDKYRERFYAFGDVKTYVSKIDFFENKLYVKYANNILIYQIENTIPLQNPTQMRANSRVLLNYNREQKNPALKIDFQSEILSNAFMPDGSLWLQLKDRFFRWKQDPATHTWMQTDFTYPELGLQEKKSSLIGMTGLPRFKNLVYFCQGNTLTEYDAARRKITWQKAWHNETEPLTLRFEAFTENDIYIFLNNQTYLFTPQTRQFRQLFESNADQSLLFYDIPFADKNQIIWHPTNGWGIYKTDTRKQRFTSFNKNRAEIPLHAIFKNFPADLPPMSGYPTPDVLLTFQGSTTDTQHNYWFCPYKYGNQQLYLAKYDVKSRKLTNFPVIGASSVGAVLYCDRFNQLWIFQSTDPQHNYIHQINTYNGTIAASYLIPLPRNYGDEDVISQAYTDPNRQLWLVTTLGLVRFNTVTKTFKTWYQEKNNPLSKDLHSIEPDPYAPAQTLWIGSNGYGLIRFHIQDETIRVFNEKNGLPNNVIYCIATGNDKNLWFSTNKGISCFNPLTQSLRNFSQADGLPGDEFNRHEMLRLQNGKLVFGGVNGLVYFDPLGMAIKQKEAPMAFTGLSIAGKPVDWRTHPQTLSAPVTFCKEIVLSPDQNNFTIQFATLEFRNSENKLYKYRLLGFDDAWSAPGNKNEATFTNLSPGTYTLQVTGTNSDGVWNTEGIKINIRVLPAWYQTWIFRILVFLLLAMGLYFLYRYRLRQELKLMHVRNRIASDLHDELGSTLSSISMYSEAASRMEIENPQVKTVLYKIHENTTQVLESMGDIVWAVNSKNDHLHHIINRMRNFAIQLAEAKGFEFAITENSALPDIALELNKRKNLYLIFKEAVNNAAKYSKCKTLRTMITVKRNELAMEITDDGVGFDPETQTHLNQGNGLYNMKRRAADVNGSILFESAPGKGTRILVQIPLDA